MKNLFDLAMDIRYNRYLLEGLNAISKSTAFPVIPVTMQQKVEKLMHSVSDSTSHLQLAWGPNMGLLEEFISYLDATKRPQPSDSSLEFIQSASKLINDYLKTSGKRQLSSFRDPEDFGDKREPVPVVPKKRKKSDGPA